MTPEEKAGKLTQAAWQQIENRCQEAGIKREQSAREWMHIAYDVTAGAGEPERYWANILAQVTARCGEKRYECPKPSYLMKLVNVLVAYGKDADGDIPISVLIEGIKLEDPKIVLRDGITVQKAKAVVKLVNDGVAPEELTDTAIELVEKEQKRKAESSREHGDREEGTKRVYDWKKDESNDLLPDIEAKAVAYQSTLLRFRREGVEFDASETDPARHQVEGLVRLLEELSPALV